VIEYYTPGIRAHAVGASRVTVPKRGRVFLLASFLDTGGVAGEVGSARYVLAHSRLHLASSDHLEKIYAWEYR
jgi:hypothetical protein